MPVAMMPDHATEGRLIRGYIAWRNGHTDDPTLRHLVRRANAVKLVCATGAWRWPAWTAAWSVNGSARERRSRKSSPA